MRPRFLAAASVGAIMLLSHGFAAKVAEIKVIAAAPMTAVFKELEPQFERDTGAQARHDIRRNLAGEAGDRRRGDVRRSYFHHVWDRRLDQRGQDRRRHACGCGLRQPSRLLKNYC